MAVPTTSGESANQIASAVANAFLQSGGTAACPANQNARDMVADLNTVFTVQASELIICARDNGVGFTLVPDSTIPPNSWPPEFFF